MPDNNQSDNNTKAVISDHTIPTEDVSAANINSTEPLPLETIAQNIATENASSTTTDSMEVLTDNKKSVSGKKMIATMFGILFLIGGVAAGVFLVQRQQNLEEKAASGAECTQASDCILLEDPGNAGNFSAPRAVMYLDITAHNSFRFFPEAGRDSPSNDYSCYNVSINGRSISWQKVDSGPDCQDISNIQVWHKDDEQGSSLVASCSEITAYDSSWNQLSQSQLSELNAGDVIKLSVTGHSTSGTIDKARFRINSSEWIESTELKPGEVNTYFINYTIPEDVKDFTVNGQVHLVENDNWY